MMNFTLLSEKERQDVWRRFNKDFNFAPSTTVFPGVHTSKPSIKFDISHCFNPDFNFELLEKTAVKIFTDITDSNDFMYALDWQHPCYQFNPRKIMERDEFGEWLVPIFPNGDYYIFLTPDFNNVWFGHPWEKSITLIGNQIVSHQNMLSNVLNNNSSFLGSNVF